MLTTKDLRNAYENFNDGFFDSRIKIPKNRVSFGDKEECDGCEGLCSRDGYIFINRELRKHADLAFIVLLHEMTHAVLFQQGYIGHEHHGGHSQLFHAELHRLYLAGAYEELF